MILLIDHYDSFTFNLYQQISELGKTVKVVRYDEITVDAIEAMQPEAIVFSPGPGHPKDKQQSLTIIRALYHRYPMLGICLGHQLIALAFGGTITRATQIKHGKTSLITHHSEGPFSAFTAPIVAMRYHSLVVDETPAQFSCIATAVDDDTIMAIRHQHYPVVGLQFHPESIGTKDGTTLLAQFFRSYHNTTSIQQHLLALSEGKDLPTQALQTIMDDILEGNLTESEIAALLMGLKMKGETVEEITALVTSLTKHATPITVSDQVIDICGTGGDGVQSFNVSTTTAFVLAGAGAKVVKNGNRSVSSKTGSADVLEHLGLPLNLTADETTQLLEDIGIAFLFAPHIHPKLKPIMKVRRDLKVPTIFNLIGPLTNPIALHSQFMGVYRRDMLEKLAQTLHALGRERAVVINGAGYVDEASLAGDNVLAILYDGKVQTKIINAKDYGLENAPLDAIRGGEALENATILQGILQGERGPKRDTVIFNAAIAMFAYGMCSIEEGIERAKSSIDSGNALAKLQAMQQFAKQRLEVIS